MRLIKLSALGSGSGHSPVLAHVRALVLAAAAALSSASTASAEPTPLRVGHPDLPAGCAAAESIMAPSWRDYLDHLATRLQRPVIACGLAATDAARALRAGEVDFALVKSAQPTPLSLSDPAPDLRPILRIRSQGELPRTEVVVLGAPDMAPASAPFTALADKQFSAAIKSETPPLISVATGQTIDTAAAQQAAGQNNEETPTANESAISAIDALNDSATPKALFMLAGRYERACANATKVCKNANVIWRGFAPISTAFAVRADTPNDFLYRLIGIHVAFHATHPVFAPLLGGEQAAEIEPTDPYAFWFRSTL